LALYGNVYIISETQYSSILRLAKSQIVQRNEIIFVTYTFCFCCDNERNAFSFRFNFQTNNFATLGNIGEEEDYEIVVMRAGYIGRIRMNVTRELKEVRNIVAVQDRPGLM
jgi:hypothetical protein